ncbi:MAG: thiamine pyrophosphate-binding protein [Chloroflexi bacterium]|nr:MAG: thiamine pyrophosphate-binding protein [Chloroflexota bacterium]
MPQMTGGEALVASLRAHGLEVIFGLPGVQLDWAFNALYDAQDDITVYHTRHEQATSYMADGYARVTGKVGACLVVPGPGLLNAGAGLSTAYACSSPVLCIAGQINSKNIEAGRGDLHEIPHQLEMIRSVTKWAGRAMAPEEVPGLVVEAFRQLRSGRPRPVEIEIPPDVLRATADVTIPAPAEVHAPEGDPDLLEQAAKALGNARSPLIYAGGGILVGGAWDELKALAELLEAPVVMTGEGKGALSDRHYLAQNGVAGGKLLREADVILAVGTRFYMPYSPWRLGEEQTLIQLDVDPEEVGRNTTPHIGIVADARKGLAALAERAARHNRSRPSRKDELTALKEGIEDRLFEVQPQASLGLAVRETLPDDGVIIGGMTQVGYWSWAGMPIYEPRTWISAGYQGTLGFEYATALGAQIGAPGRKVVALCGDGGFMYNVQELSTAARFNIPVVAVVFNDGAFGNVRRMQKQDYGGKLIASDLHNPDFVLLAQSFGIEGRRANGAEELKRALTEAFADNRPYLIEVPVGEMPDMWNLLMG